MRSKVFFAFVLSVITSCLSLHAQTVSPEAARAKAMDFFSTGAKNLPARKGAMRKAPAVSNVELAYTSEKDGKTCFYVYNNGTDGGFVIVGGDEVAQEILAYSDHGHFDYDKAPDNFKDMLSQYTEQISLAKPVAKSQPAKSPAKVAAATTVQKEDIPDLIETTWDQWDPYNRAIPKLVNSNTGEEYNPPTGCVATAVAQIMKYWNYPEHGTGSISRTIDYSQENPYNLGFGGSAPEFGAVTHNIDYQNSYYDWGNMLNNYSGEETEEQINAVSTLMYHVGVACSGIYGIGETTGAYPEEGLKKYFGYSPKAKAISRDKFDDQTWEEIIYGELTQNRPVIYSGAQQEGGGHEYIVHGYSSEYDMYSINWGWGGFLDCYCKLTPVEGSTLLGYEYGQQAVVRLQPATLDSDADVDYGDIFWADGFKYRVISRIYHTVEVIRPEEDEPQDRYIGEISLPSVVSYLGEDYSVIIVDYKAFVPYDIPASYNEYPISKIISLSDNLRIIRELGFQGCVRIQDLVLPDNVSILYEYAFDRCVALKNVTLPCNLKEIRRECFGLCTSLESVVIPEGTKIIGSQAFERCGKLGYIELPSTLDSLGSGVFADCDNIEVLICKASTPPSTDVVFGTPPFSAASAQNGYLLVPEASIDLYKSARHWKDWKNIVPIESTDLSMIGETFKIDNIEYKIIPAGAEVKEVLYSSPTITIPDVVNVNNKEYKVVSIGQDACSVYCDSVILPQFLTTIKPYAFKWCDAKSISIPNSVTSIGAGAFLYCENLEKIRIPDLIEEVSFGWFGACKNLHLVEIPQNVKQVPSSYEGLPNLFTIICHSKEVPNPGGEGAIGSCSVEGTLYVPSGSVQQYRNAIGWKNWRFIKSIDEFDADEQPIKVTENGIQYRILNHGAVVLRPTEGTENVIIPESIEYDGQSYDVISIAEEAFRWYYIWENNGWNPINSVQLPTTIHSIMKYAFQNQTELNTINFPDNITYIGREAFEGCTKLQDVTLPDSLKVIYNAFRGTAIDKLIIPEGTVTVGEGLYGIYLDDMKELKEVVYPSTLELKSNYGIYLGRAEKVYILSPSFANVWSVEGEKVYVPNDLVETCKNHDNWHVKEVLPIIPLTSVKLNEEEMALATGKRSTLAAESSPADASLKYVKWSSSDPAIASVDKNGVVTARKSGTVTITATSMYYPDVAATCTVTVKAGTVGTLVDAIDGLPSGRTTLKDVDDAVDSILER